MLVYENKDEHGNLVSFDIEANFTRKNAVRIIGLIPGVTVLTTSKEPYWLRDEVFCKFKINDMGFEIWEPFGDNSRFTILSENSDPDSMEVLSGYLKEYIHKPTPFLTLFSLAIVVILLIVIGNPFNK